MGKSKTRAIEHDTYGIVCSMFDEQSRESYRIDNRQPMVALDTDMRTEKRRVYSQNTNGWRVDIKDVYFMSTNGYLDLFEYSGGALEKIVRNINTMAKYNKARTAIRAYNNTSSNTYMKYLEFCAECGDDPLAELGISKYANGDTEYTVTLIKHGPHALLLDCRFTNKSGEKVLMHELPDSVIYTLGLQVSTDDNGAWRSVLDFDDVLAVADSHNDLYNTSISIDMDKVTFSFCVADGYATTQAGERDYKKEVIAEARRRLDDL